MMKYTIFSSIYRVRKIVILQAHTYACFARNKSNEKNYAWSMMDNNSALFFDNFKSR